MIDPKNKLDRLLMFLPGFSSWLMLLMPIWLGYIAPRVASFVLIYFSIYWIYLGLTGLWRMFTGYQKYKKEIEIDWYKKCINLDYSSLKNKETLPDKFSDLKHFVLIPLYKEPYELLEATFSSIVNSNYPMKNIILVLGTEEGGLDIIKPNIDRIKKKFEGRLPQIYEYTHPKGIPNEITGVATANRTWAASHAVKQIIKDKKEIKNYIFTTFDSDTKIHKEFLARVAFEYLTEENRYNKFYETCVHIFSNNIWDVPLASRLECYTLTLGALSRWPETHNFEETFSCYSCALDTLISANYWDTKFIDDSVFFWRAFKARQGQFEGDIIYIPISLDATNGNTYLEAHTNLFQQYIRWGWGSVTTVMALKNIFSKNNEVSFNRKVMWLYFKLERHIILRTSSILIGVGFIIVTYINETFRNTSFVYSIPHLISLLQTILIFSFLPITYLRRKIYGLPPKRIPKWRHILSLLENPLIFINLYTFDFLPWIYAETQMMFGKLPKTTFYTAKQR